MLSSSHLHQSVGMAQKPDSMRLQELHLSPDSSNAEIEHSHNMYDKDNMVLTRLGKRPVLKEGILLFHVMTAMRLT